MRQNIIHLLSNDHGNETTRKLFHDFRVDDAVFYNQNLRYLCGYEIAGKNAYYKDGYIRPSDKLYYKNRGYSETYAVSMAELKIYAIAEYDAYNLQSISIFYKCIHTGDLFELSDDKTDQLSELLCENTYARRNSMAEKDLRGLQVVTFYNQRYLRLHNFLNKNKS